VCFSNWFAAVPQETLTSSQRKTKEKAVQNSREKSLNKTQKSPAKTHRTATRLDCTAGSAQWYVKFKVNMKNASQRKVSKSVRVRMGCKPRSEHKPFT